MVTLWGNYEGISQYWMFTLINAIVGAIINVIQLILGLEFPFLSLIYLAATIIPVIVKWSTKTGHRVRVFSSID
ncbi:hypothetical protein FSG06_025800, partial [Escherichia coli]|nr:hypothetical protein [Escherichia coli]